MTYFNTLAFGIYPYVAMIILFIGSWIRYDREQYTWKASSSQLLEKKKLRTGSILFHVGVLGIFFGHFFVKSEPNVQSINVHSTGFKLIW